ncbi:hypothetical protein NVP1177O_71 [Vibrio phage 1.177.O._10N.286.45.E10]|nr:hypothetical protein NVP1177O_71 [Vibrio phage 1.177.O._10N.286.45.E10]
MAGFIKYMRSEESEFLLKYPNANHLFMVMAFRARRTDHPMNGLKAGQCFLGDYSSIGLTERQYRTAKKQLTDWKLATFKGTNKGTVGTIVNTKVYDINEDNGDGLDVIQKTGKRQASDRQATTNKECNNEKNEETIPLTKMKEIPEGVNHEAWSEWLSYKKETRSPYKTERGEKAKVNELIKLSYGNQANQLLIVRQSIDNEWKGLFELKNKPVIQQSSQQQQYDHEAARQREIEEIRKGLM